MLFRSVTVARGEDGQPFFELRVPMAGKPTAFDVSGDLYSRLDGPLLRSRTNFQGTFQVRQFPSTLVRKRRAADRPYLTLGAGPDAALLRELDIEPQPFQLRYTPSMSSAFDLPTPVS